ncbi:MAG: hypothetical protein DRI71_08305 [Bacteroidetes bacterium]|nr:MAG: hypothetical protein DRI71_08305 [Bacteroidota bacterium]
MNYTSHITGLLNKIGIYYLQGENRKVFEDYKINAIDVSEIPNGIYLISLNDEQAGKFIIAR